MPLTPAPSTVTSGSPDGASPAMSPPGTANRSALGLAAAADGALRSAAVGGPGPRSRAPSAAPSRPWLLPPAGRRAPVVGCSRRERDTERARDEEPGQAQGGEAGAQGSREGEPRARERGEQAAPAGGPERGGLRGGQAEVAGAGRGRQCGQGRGDGPQVVVEGRAVRTGGDQGQCVVELGAGRIARGIGGDRERIVVGVAGGKVRHLPLQTTVGPMRFRQPCRGSVRAAAEPSQARATSVGRRTAARPA